MDSRVILVGSLVGFLKNRSSSVSPDPRSTCYLVCVPRCGGAALVRPAMNISRGRLTDDAVNHAARRHLATLF